VPGAFVASTSFNLRKHLSAAALIQLLGNLFANIPDPHADHASITLRDALLSGFALFHLKSPSLLAFDQQRREGNRKALYHIQRVPCDTQMRTILDEVLPEDLRPAFPAIFRQLQRGKVLEDRVFFQGCYLLSLDGTEYFSSDAIHCSSCLQRKSGKGDKITYYHQVLGAALVHPDQREVIPLMPEPIIKQDGQTKNDCERNAAKRFLAKFRQDHPHLKVIITEDGLSANGPHILELKRQRMHFILGVKAGDHGALFQHVEEA
jgi:hypothetical protein